MANIFNEDFRDFVAALKKNEVRYILVGGFAVILHDIHVQLVIWIFGWTGLRKLFKTENGFLGFWNACV
ncbi:hypothetical protein ABTW23_01120 [Sphingobacterium thalpophilum]|uniref:hypothetical protein n=1 Tax=Sphingobacterium thalpophilum TaxID=259 RepID=UPI002D788BC4|nr:hypothetical protein [Sphingobacterium thalpophilum]